MYRVRVCSLLLVLIGLLALASVARAGDAEEQRQAASQFLQAYVRQDIASVRTVVPDNYLEMFGKYPFTGVYKLETPKVDDHQALVDFTGPVADAACPPKGGLLLKFEKGQWLVRQVLFFDQVPRLLNLPSRSVTTTDRANEPAVKAVASRFLEAWKSHDVKSMETLIYKWTTVNREPTKGLSISNIILTNGVMAQNEPIVKYSAKITYRWGLLAYSMNFKGTLLLVKEHGAWHVRGSLLLFDF